MLATLLYDILSWFLSILDLLFPVLNSLPGGPKFFSEGYGNPKIYFDRRNIVLQSLRANSYNFERKNMELVERSRDSQVITSEGQFQLAKQQDAQHIKFQKTVTAKYIKIILKSCHEIRVYFGAC